MTALAPVAVVITVSDRVSRGSADDMSGPLAAELLAAAGIEVRSRVLVPDEQPDIAQACLDAVAAGADVIVLTGGTGLAPRDVTPEAIAPLLTRTLPGIPEAIRAASRERVPSTDLSRMLAGVIGQTLVIALPGSTGGVRDGLTVVAPLLHHALDVLAGGTHPTAEATEPKTPGRVMLAAVRSDSLSVLEHENLVAGPSYGAVVSFAGVVRNHDDDRTVLRLDYEGHPDAERILDEVAHDVVGARPDVAVAVSHRIGSLAIGDAALVVAVAAPHRADAFAVCARMVDAVKAQLPIWKHQFFADGTDEWVNAP